MADRREEMLRQAGEELSPEILNSLKVLRVEMGLPIIYEGEERSGDVEYMLIAPDATVDQIKQAIIETFMCEHCVGDIELTIEDTPSEIIARVTAIEAPRKVKAHSH